MFYWCFIEYFYHVTVLSNVLSNDRFSNIFFYRMIVFFLLELSFCWMPVFLNDCFVEYFVELLFHWIIVLSIGFLVEWLFCWMMGLSNDFWSNDCFIVWLFYRMIVLSNDFFWMIALSNGCLVNACFIEWFFCWINVLSSDCFIVWLFCRIIVLSSIYFLEWLFYRFYCCWMTALMNNFSVELLFGKMVAIATIG